jgi:site-specific DNA-methyltransferase (adenine-specific)
VSQIIRLRHGDCIVVLRSMESGAIDAFICDPPYFLGFMGKDFDKQEGAHQDPKAMQERHLAWVSECYRVLPSGGVLKAFSGTRTNHRLAAAMEAVGFVLVPGESLEAWAYGSGFPKSLDISKAIDKHHGAEREVVGARHRNVKPFDDMNGWNANNTTGDHEYTAPATDDAKRFDGYGTALKPAWEPILVGRKPIGDCG